MNKNKLLRRNLVIYVLEDSVTKEEILHMNYNDSKIDHFARKRIKSTIR